jgi:molybdopterin/thiamine biosynthesis adenylyltransferase
MDYNRQSKLLDVSKIKKKSITLIGVGATGSHIASLLTQMGWGDEGSDQGVLNVWDFDKVEEHNLANQTFEPSQIGMQKVDALNENVKRKCGFKIRTFNERVTNQTAGIQSTYVFLLTDTMASRKEIFDNCLKFSFNTQLVVETRMGLNEGRIYAFNPGNREHVREWEASLYSDKEAETSLCGTSYSIAMTAVFIASLATSRVIQHFNDIQPEIWNEMHFSLCPESFYYRRFGQNPNFLPSID